LAADQGAEYDRITKRLHAERDGMYVENIRRFCTGVEMSEPDAEGYVEVSFAKVVIDLDQLEPMMAAPGSPDNIIPVREVAGQTVRQVAIGSCTNSSYQDLMLVAGVLKGRTVHPEVELGIAPGSRQVMEMIARSGGLVEMVSAGARILESACGPCIGLGFSPSDDAVSLRTFNRNFTGRSGTRNDKVYLVSPEVAIAAAITGEVTDPRSLTGELGIEYPAIDEPGEFLIDDSLIIEPVPEDQAGSAEIVRGSTIVKPPAGETFPETLTGQVTIKVPDKVTTDHIMPAGALLKFRSNVPEYAKHVFTCYNEEGGATFAERCLSLKEQGKPSIIVAGDSYGQGSSREHAALCPMYLGVKVVLAKAIERIHQANLVNFGILPLLFAGDADYEAIRPGDDLTIENVPLAIESAEQVAVRNETQATSFTAEVVLSQRQRDILAAGGLLNFTRQQGE
jgi:aconitate hydratase